MLAIPASPRTRLHAARFTVATLVLALTHATSSAGVNLQPGEVVMIAAAYNYNAPVNSIVAVTGGGQVAVIASGAPLSSPRDLVVLNDGRILVADQASGLLEVQPATGVVSVLVGIAELGGSGPTALALAPNSDVLMAGTWGVSRLAGGTGPPVAVSGTGLLTDPRGIAVDATGTIWVADYGMNLNNSTYTWGGIVRVDPVTGAQSLLAVSTVPGYFPQGLEALRTGADGALYVVNDPAGAAQWTSGGIWRVDPGSGNATMWTHRVYMRDFHFLDPSQVLMEYAYDLSHSPYSGILATFDGATTTQINGNLPTGRMAVVPGTPTPTRRSSWGAIKSLYR